MGFRSFPVPCFASCKVDFILEMRGVGGGGTGIRKP
jgi:hypothetical protein